jgi:cation/acetate symporter
VSLPKPGPAVLSRPADQPFSAFSPADFVLLVLCLATGIAAHPALLTRLTTTPTILGTRRSFGWVALIAGLIVLTIPAYALFTKSMVMSGLVGVPVPDLPAFGRTLEQLGLVSMPAMQFGTPEASAPVMFHRDTVALLLPVAAGLPRVFLGLAAAAAIAALSACGAAQLVAIGNSISDDLYHGALHKTASPSRRLVVARLSMLLFGLVVFAFCRDPNLDPLRLALEAFSLSAGTFFAVLVLSVWWRRLSAAGAVAGMAAGFAVTAIFLFGTPLFGIDRLTAGAIGLPVSFAAAIVVSLARRPDAAALEAVDELRVPAGETLQARALRLGAKAKPQRSG